MNWFLIICFILICLQNQSSARPTSEDGILLRQIASNFSAPLVASILHARLQNAAEMVDAIKNSLPDLHENQRNMLTLKVKSLEALDEQLTSLQKTAYFSINGTDRVKNLIEQYILNDEMFPTELGSEEGNFNLTCDDLLKQINVVSHDRLIEDTNALINLHLEDIEDKESNLKYNQLQRLAASLTKRKLKPLANFNYSQPKSKYGPYGNEIGIIDNRSFEIEYVLRKVKNILNLFYPQFAALENRDSTLSVLEPVSSEGKTQKAVNSPDFNSILEVNNNPKY